MSPELFDPEVEDHHRTRHSDCYALGMVIYEVLSRQIPFYQYANLVIPGKVLRGDRPEKPQGPEGVWFVDDMWGILERCWAPQSGNRTSIKDVLQCLERVSRSWTLPPRLLAVASIPSPLTRRYSDTIVVESTDRNVVSTPSQVAPPQLSERLDTGIISGVGRTSLLKEFLY